MNETYDKLIDIIAVDIKLAIELIKGQDINVKEFINYIMEDIEFLDLLEINSISIVPSFLKPDEYYFNDYSQGMIYPESIPIIKIRLIEYLNKLKNEQN